MWSTGQEIVEKKAGLAKWSICMEFGAGASRFMNFYFFCLFVFTATEEETKMNAEVSSLKLPV